MKINILKDDHKALLSRFELNTEIEFEGATPSKEAVKKEIAKKQKKNEEVIVVKNIFTKFGTNTASSLIYIYDNKKNMDSIEPKVKKDGKKKEEKKDNK